MAPSRVYILSRTLPRSLLRSNGPRCHLAPRLPTQFTRGKRTKPNERIVPLPPELGEQSGLKLPPFPKDWLKPSGDVIPVSFYEQDLDKGTPERLVKRITTREDYARHNETNDMLEEDDRNPRYDDSELKRRLIDDLMLSSNFADLTEELQAMKSAIMTKEEKEQWLRGLRQEVEPEMQEYKSQLRMATYESIQELIDNPDLVDAREELLDVQAKMPESVEGEDPEFRAALERAERKLSTNELFLQKVAAEGGDRDLTTQDTEKDLEQFNPDEKIDSPEGLNKLLVQMKELMASMGGDKQIEAELDAVINEDPFAQDESDMEREIDFGELAAEIKKLAEASPPPEEGSKALEEDVKEEEEDPELKAKVDKIMDDPKLMEKLMYIQKIISRNQRPADLTDIKHEVAPDPYELEASRTTSLGHRLKVAQNDPEHIIALRRLRVNLLPPFNISPALKSFNQAIEFAYIGANDDIRRILWRSYVKARTLPTFLQNLSDDAWDLIYYSQAVTWGSNQNRHNHLRLLLADLRNVGRDGPPTHPGTLIPEEEQ